jgi:hypothetical protein
MAQNCLRGSGSFQRGSKNAKSLTSHDLENRELQDQGHDRRWIVGIGFDAMLGFAVHILAVVIQLPELFRIARQRAMRLAFHPRADTGEGTIQPNGDAAFFEQLAIGWI